MSSAELSMTKALFDHRPLLPIGKSTFRTWQPFTYNILYTPRVINKKNSAKLTNQCLSYVFTSSPFSIHVHHILPTSKFQHSYSCILFIFYRHQWTACVKTVSVKQFTGWTLPLRGIPVNNPITLTSSLQTLSYISCRWQYMRSSANFSAVFSESQNANPLDAEPETHFNAKSPFWVIQCHLFQCQWATEGLHSTI